MTADAILDAVKEIKEKVEKIYNEGEAPDISLSEINALTRELSLLGILYRAQSLEESILKREQ